MYIHRIINCVSVSLLRPTYSKSGTKPDGYRRLGAEEVDLGSRVELERWRVLRKSNVSNKTNKTKSISYDNRRMRKASTLN